MQSEDDLETNSLKHSTVSSGSLGISLSTNTVSNGFSESDMSVSQRQHSQFLTPLHTPTVSSISDLSDNLENLFGLRAQYHNHPLIGFLNINSLRYKIVDLRIIVEKFLPDILVIEETKLNSEFNNNAFLINNYQTPMRRDVCIKHPRVLSVVVFLCLRSQILSSSAAN